MYISIQADNANQDTVLTPQGQTRLLFGVPVPHPQLQGRVVEHFVSHDGNIACPL